MKLALATLFLVLTSVTSGCTGAKFVAQGAHGQFKLWRHARPIDDVIQDPEAPELTRRMLAHVRRIKDFAQLNGLQFDGNYEQFVALEKPYVVWAVNASKPLAFEPKIFSFPIVGSFPSLSWFDEAEANEFGRELAAEGWDVHVRGVGAYSTAGWFDDPILSSMISDGPNAISYLANIVIHESVHATVLIKDQQFFNESIASFVADRMADQYLDRELGRDSAVLKAYRANRNGGSQVTEYLVSVHARLDALYRSSRSDSVKLREKASIMAEVQQRLRLPKPPNNATLIGYKLYRTAKDEFGGLYEACGEEWKCFLAAAGSLDGSAFAREQLAEFGPVVEALRQRVLARLTTPGTRAASLSPESLQQR